MRGWTLLTLALLAATTAPAGDKVLVPLDVAPWGAVHVETFDPRHEPQDLAFLPGGRRAVADAFPFIGWTGGALDGDWDTATQTLTLTAVAPIKLQGFTRVRQSQTAGPTIRAHEAGHDTLNANEWLRSAFTCAQTALQGFPGTPYHGVGDTDASAQQDAWKRARADRDQRMSNACGAILKRMSSLADLYDGITDHGRNPGVDSAKGVQLALQKRDAPP